MNAIEVSKHELRHVFAYAASMVALSNGQTYAAALVHCHVWDEGGEAALLLDGPQNHDLQRKCSQLGALGPVAAAGDNILSLLKSANTEAIREAGQLSPRDEELARAWDGPPLLPVIIVLATRALEKRIGPERFDKLATIIREISNQGLGDDPFRLSSFVPHVVASEALTSARAVLDKAMGVPNKMKLPGSTI